MASHNRLLTRKDVQVRRRHLSNHKPISLRNTSLKLKPKRRIENVCVLTASSPATRRASETALASGTGGAALTTPAAPADVRPISSSSRFSPSASSAVAPSRLAASSFAAANFSAVSDSTHLQSHNQPLSQHPWLSRCDGGGCDVCLPPDAVRVHSCQDPRCAAAVQAQRTVAIRAAHLVVREP